VGGYQRNQSRTARGSWFYFGSTIPPKNLYLSSPVQTCRSVPGSVGLHKERPVHCSAAHLSTWHLLEPGIRFREGIEQVLPASTRDIFAHGDKEPEARRRFANRYDGKARAAHNGDEAIDCCWARRRLPNALPSYFKMCCRTFKSTSVTSSAFDPP
jgi:hypothetical protein